MSMRGPRIGTQRGKRGAGNNGDDTTQERGTGRDRAKV